MITGFQDRRNNPLCQISLMLPVGFEPTCLMAPVPKTGVYTIIPPWQLTVDRWHRTLIANIIACRFSRPVLYHLSQIHTTYWWPDSNRHGFFRQGLSLLRLPISPHQCMILTGIEPVSTSWEDVVLPLDYRTGVTTGNRTPISGTTIRCFAVKLWSQWLQPGSNRAFQPWKGYVLIRLDDGAKIGKEGLEPSLFLCLWFTVRCRRRWATYRY